MIDGLVELCVRARDSRAFLQRFLVSYDQIHSRTCEMGAEVVNMACLVECVGLLMHHPC